MRASPHPEVLLRPAPAGPRSEDCRSFAGRATVGPVSVDRALRRSELLLRLARNGRKGPSGVIPYSCRGPARCAAAPDPDQSLSSAKTAYRQAQPVLRLPRRIVGQRSQERKCFGWGGPIFPAILRRNRGCCKDRLRRDRNDATVRPRRRPRGHSSRACASARKSDRRARAAPI